MQGLTVEPSSRRVSPRDGRATLPRRSHDGRRPDRGAHPLHGPRSSCTLGTEGVTVSTFARWGKRVVYRNLFPKLPSRVSTDTPAVVSAPRLKSHAIMLRAIDALAAQVTKEIDETIHENLKKWPNGDRVIAAWDALANSGASSTSGSAPVATLAPDARLTMLAQVMAGKRQLRGVASLHDLPEVTKSALTELGGELRKKTRAVLGAWDELRHRRESASKKDFAGVKGLSPAQISQAHAWCVKESRVRSEGERDGEGAHARLGRSRRAHPAAPRLFPGPARAAHRHRTACRFACRISSSTKCKILVPWELRVLLDLAGTEPSVTLTRETSRNACSRTTTIAARRVGRSCSRQSASGHLLGADEGSGLEPLKVQLSFYSRKLRGLRAASSVRSRTRRSRSRRAKVRRWSRFHSGRRAKPSRFFADALKELSASEPNAERRDPSRASVPQADVYDEGLRRAEVPNVRRVKKQDFSWEPGVDVTDVRQTKGLEWDEIVLVEANRRELPRHGASAPRALRRRHAGGASALVRHHRRAVEARGRRAHVAAHRSRQSRSQRQRIARVRACDQEIRLV